MVIRNIEALDLTSIVVIDKATSGRDLSACGTATCGIPTCGLPTTGQACYRQQGLALGVAPARNALRASLLADLEAALA